MNQFECWSARLAQRARLLHGVETSSWALLLALFVTLSGLLAEVFFGRLFSPVIWLSANLLAVAGGFLWGWLRPLKLSKLLYQADRRIGWGEKLITLYELKAARSEFLPLLERDWEKLVARHPVTFERALSLESSVQRRWGGALALSLLCFALVSYQGLLPSAPVLPTAEPQSEALNNPAALLPSPPPTLSGKIPTWREKLAQARTALAQTPDDQRARAALEQLQAEISEAQDRLWFTPPKQSPGPTPSAKKPQGSDATVTDDPSGLQQRSAGQSNDKLDQMMRDLRAIQGQAQALSPTEMQKLLDELRAQNPEALSLLEGPTGSAKTSEEFSRQLEEALKNLEERQSLQQQLAELQREIQAALAQPPGRAQADQPPGSGEPHGPSQSSGKAPAAGESEGPRDPQGTSQPSGGKGTAPLDPQAERDLPDLSGLREQIRQIPVTGSQEEQLQLLFEIFQTGMPVEAPSPVRAKPIQIDYQKVETLLDALAVPPELRETVRKYFITLAQRSP